MGRGAVLVGAVLWGCSSVVRAPPALSRHASDEKVPPPSQRLTDTQLGQLVEYRLGQLANVLEPLCGFDCSSLEVEPYSKLDRAVALRIGRSRKKFVVLYQPEEFQRWLASSESMATYGLAHEMGHYIDIAIAGEVDDDPWRRELAADAVAGCACAALGLRVDVVRIAMLAAAAPEDSIESRVELVCGSDSQHPATRWAVEALETGMRLCQTSVVPLERVEAEVTDLTQDARSAAAKAQKHIPPFAAPCRWRHLDDNLPPQRTP